MKKNPTPLNNVLQQQQAVSITVFVILLEYLEGNRGIFDGNDDTTVVQIQDMMLLLKHLSKATCLEITKGMTVTG